MPRNYSQEAIFAVRSLCLGDIESKVEWANLCMADLKRYCNLIVSLPDWDTEAEDGVARIRAAAEELLRNAEAAEDRMKAKRANAEFRKLHATFVDSLSGASND